MKDITQSQTFRGIILGLGGGLILLLVFQAGVFVGYKKASFSYQVGEQYFTRAFGPEMRGGMQGVLPTDNLFEAHGVVGKVLSISLPTLMVSGPDTTERVIRTDESTVVRQLRETISVKDITKGSVITVIGTPNTAGEIEAKLIRILPPLPEGQS